MISRTPQGLRKTCLTLEKVPHNLEPNYEQTKSTIIMHWKTLQASFTCRITSIHRFMASCFSFLAYLKFASPIRPVHTIKSLTLFCSFSSLIY